MTAHIRSRTTFLPALLLLAPIALSAPLYAQDSEGEEVALEEVIVTATRMRESLQDIPVSVSALSSMQMEQRNIENTRDLQASVPNISISANTGTASGGRIFIRGIGDDESRIGADSAVAAYVDGVRRVAEFDAYERLFSLWHAFHLPFCVMLFLAAAVHVVAVHMY